MHFLASSNHNYLLKGPPPNLITLEAGASMYECVGDANIPSITSCKLNSYSALHILIYPNPTLALAEPSTVPFLQTLGSSISKCSLLSSPSLTLFLH